MEAGEGGLQWGLSYDSPTEPSGLKEFGGVPSSWSCFSVSPSHPSLGALVFHLSFLIYSF